METIYSILEKHAVQSGNHTAVLGTGGEEWSWSELLKEVDHIKASLEAAGIGKQDRVAIVLKDGPLMAVTFIGVSCACACAPLNPAYRARDFAFYLDDLQAKAVIVAQGDESEVIPVAEERGIPVLKLAVKRKEAAPLLEITSEAGQSGAMDSSPPEPDAVALILHTSGTTSRPKMVPLSHENLTTSAANVASTLDLVPADRGLVVMPLFHIHGLVGALLSSVSAGSSVVCSPGFDALNFLEWAGSFSVTWYSAVPTMHQALLGHALANPAKMRGIRLRFARSSSASLPPRVFHDLVDLWKAPVVESYGMTEAAHQMTSNPIAGGSQKPGSVGLPAGPSVAVLKEDGSQAGPGETGPIVIRGANVTTGYLNNAEANRENFRDGWFQTGDQGYFDEDGYLFLTGRLKEMINRGGENIAPREIDEVLLEHPAVAQATAFAIPHETLGEDLAAAVVLRDGATATEQEFRRYVAEILAPFKVPNRVVFVSSIPKGPTGKLQRIGLHEKLAEALKTDFVEPRTETEKRVADIFKTALQAERIGVKDNFFFAGGDSLRATRVVNSLRKEYPGDLPLTLVFLHPTAEQLASHLDALEDSGDDVEALARELESLSPEEIEKLLSDED